MRENARLSRRGALTTALTLPLVTGLGPSVCPAAVRQAGSNGRILVAYFSRTGNTRVVADQIRRASGADLFEIAPREPYPDDYEATVRQAQRERNSGDTPPLAARIADMDAYGVLFLGFPIWATSAPAVIRSFLAGHDLSGKTLVPFTTHGGYGRGDSMAVLAALAPRARIVDGFAIKADQERETSARVARWLGSIHIE